MYSYSLTWCGDPYSRLINCVSTGPTSSSIHGCLQINSIYH